MQDVGYAALQIIPSFKDLDKNLEAGTSKAMMAAGVRGGARYGDAAGRSAGQRFGRMFMTTAKVGLAGLAVLTAGAIKLGKDSVAEARDAQKVGALTASTIKATGGAAKVTAKQVADLAEKISLKTGIDDEAIQSGQNMLLTFKNIRNEAGEGNKIFDQTTQTLVDMSSAMGTDAKSSAIQLGKALNDPVKGITALTRVGVTFTEGQKEQIAALVESGDTMAAQKIILKELNSEFGGAAAAQATLGDKVSVAWGNIEEKLGTVLLPLIDDVESAFLEKGVPAAEKFIGWFEDEGVPKIRKFAGFVMDEVVPAVSDFAGNMKPLAESLLPAAGTALGIIADGAKTAAPFVKDMVDSFNDMPDWAKMAVVGGGAGLFAGKKLGLGPMGGGGGLAGALAGGVQKVWVTNPGFGVGGATTAAGRGGAVVAGGPKGGMTLTKGFITIAAAYFAADAITKVLGWKEQGPKGAAKEEAFREKWGVGPLEAGNNANYALFDKTGVDPGAGLFGLKRNDEGLGTELMAQDVGTLIRLGKELREEYGRGYEALERMGRLPDGFTDWFKTQKQEARELAATFEKFPDDLKTHITLMGAPESRREAMELVRQYDLTPKEKRTLFETYNIPDAKRTVNDYKGVLGSVPEKESTNFSIYGIESAQAKLNQAARMLQSLDGRTYRTVLELHTVRTGAGGQGLGYNGAAGGGTVPKTGMGYADRHPYLLADGEEVISNRYGQADRYRSLLKAINANRRLADGGTAGTGRGGSVVVERVIEREVIPNGTRIAIGQNGELELVVDRRITRHQKMRRGQKGYGP